MSLLTGEIIGPAQKRLMRNMGRLGPVSPAPGPASGRLRRLRLIYPPIRRRK